MASIRGVEELTTLVNNVVNSRLLSSLADLRTSHSHSDLLLPPDLAFPILSTELKSFVEQNHFKAPSSKPSENPTDEEKAQNERQSKRLLWQNGARAFQLMDLVIQRPGSSSESTAHLDNTALKALFDRLDVIIAFELEGLADASVPLHCVEAVMDSLPLTSCAKLLDFIESRKDYLLPGSTQLSPSRGKGPILLRIGNELRRRLSKPAMHDTILAGRIAALLSGAFPLGERSGSNQEGRFNVDNKTLVEEDESTGEKPEGMPAGETSEDQRGSVKETGEVEDPLKTEASSAEPEEGAHPEKPLSLKEKATPDSGFYTLFWSVQQFFANPNLLFEESSILPAELLEGLEDPAPPPPAAKAEDAGALREFRIATKRIVDLMSAVNEHELSLAGAAKKDLFAHSMQDTAGAVMEEDENSDERESFFPKYLTGRKILASEVRDPSFRRQVLVQFLILLQYILEFNPKRRSVWENSKNRLLLRPFVLAESDVDWCGSTWRSILTLLKEIPGPQTYVASTTQALRREHHWTQWKLDMCPPLQKAEPPAEEFAPFADGLKKLRRMAPVYPQKMGTMALKQLWEEGIPPHQPGKRKRENDEGIEVEVSTDGLEELEFPPMALDFDVYTRKWRKLEEKADARRKELGHLRGTERREKEMRALAEALTMKEQRSNVINLKTQIVTLDTEMAALKSASSTDDDKEAIEKHDLKVKELQSRKEQLESQLPSDIVKKKNTDILNAASADLTRYTNDVKTEKADEKISSIVDEQFSHSWRALRLAGREHLRHLARIPADDLELLIRTLDGKFDPTSLTTVEPPKDESSGMSKISPSSEANQRPNGTGDSADAVMAEA